MKSIYKFDIFIFCNSLDSAFSVGDPVNARDLWLIVELQSDSRGRRTHLGKVCCQLLHYYILFFYLHDQNKKLLHI